VSPVSRSEASDRETRLPARLTAIGSGPLDRRFGDTRNYDNLLANATRASERGG
jgi:hypothetical protein